MLVCHDCWYIDKMYALLDAVCYCAHRVLSARGCTANTPVELADLPAINGAVAHNLSCLKATVASHRARTPGSNLPIEGRGVGRCS